MEMNVNTGKGYVPAELNKPEEPPLDHKVEFSNEFFFKSCKEASSYLVRCPLAIKKRNKIKRLTIFAHAKTKSRAIQKAKRKHQRKCSKIKSKRKCQKFRRKLCSIEKV